MQDMSHTLPLTDAVLAAYNEAGHCIVGRFQGRAITAVYNLGSAWGTFDDDMNMVNIRSDVELHFPYAKLDRKPPQVGWVPSKEDNCTFKLAGIVAEKLFCEHNSTDSSKVHLAERDDLEAKAYAQQRYPEDPEAQQNMYHNAEIEARYILSDSSCWYAVECLAEVIAEVLAKETRLDGMRIHEVITQALTRNDNE